MPVFLPISVSVPIPVPKTSGTGIGTDTKIPVGKLREPQYRYRNTGFAGAPNSHPWFNGCVSMNFVRLKLWLFFSSLEKMSSDNLNTKRLISCLEQTIH